MNLPDGKIIMRHADKLESDVAQDKRGNRQNCHQTIRYELFGVGEAETEENKQKNEQTIRKPGRRFQNSQRTQRERNRKHHRHDERHFALGFDEAHEAAENEENDVNPENSSWVHIFMRGPVSHNRAELRKVSFNSRSR